MSEVGEAAQAIGALIIGGFLFLAFGAAVRESSSLGGGVIDFQLWGGIYLVVAVLLAVGLVVAAVRALMP